MAIKNFCPETLEWMKSSNYKIGLIEDRENELELVWEEVQRLCKEQPTEFWSKYVVMHVGSILDNIMCLALMGPEKTNQCVMWKHLYEPSKVKRKWEHYQTVVKFIKKELNKRSSACNKLYRIRNRASHNISPLEEELKLEDLRNVVYFARAVHVFVKELLKHGSS